uniref:Aflatoxin B1 aldehyde reductase member 2-like n=1 Tax=Phallusia mammillata TaxID=59560 RepID=A0A6F9D6P7_9ASCI|nr:aflatoxin B1 aldehyde reductase member 2-like [Phallusia mammillata]
MYIPYIYAGTEYRYKKIIRSATNPVVRNRRSAEIRINNRKTTSKMTASVIRKCTRINPKCLFKRTFSSLSAHCNASSSGSFCSVQRILKKSFVIDIKRQNLTMKTILGTMEMGRRLDLNDSGVMMNEFKDSGNVEIDTAFMYAGGKTEEFMGKCEVTQNKKIKIATKANPWDGKGLSAKSVRNQLETSLERLKVKSVHLFYLHAPDHDTPITDTLKAVNDLHQEGKFEAFGLSNYPAWQVAEICTICKNNGWIVPTVYQGMYNCLTRQVEKELFPCLRYFGLSFYSYNILAGGLLSGKHKFEDANKTEAGRFFGKGWAKAYRDRFWKKDNFECIKNVQTVLDEVYGPGAVTMAEAAYRWLFHHSCLDSAKGDGVILGASSLAYFRTNLGYIGTAKLDDRVVEQIENCWTVASHTCPNYFR